MGRRNVTKLTRERAFYSIKIVAAAMLNNELALSYSELANRLQMPNETGQGLGPILDEAAAMCLENSLPDISAVVVTKRQPRKRCSNAFNWDSFERWGLESNRTGN